LTSSVQPTVRPSTPNPATMDTSAMIAALANLSPTKLAKIHDSIFNPTSASTPTPTINTATSSSSSALVPFTNNNMPPSLLFDVNNKHVSSTSISDTYGIHTYIVELARCHQHIPLSILTTKITTHLFLEPSTLKFVTHYTSHHNSTPTKCHILNISQFPAESSISIGEWHEAWACFLKLLSDYASPEVHDRWAHHHKDLCQHPDFEDHWSAILAFDMAQRASYT
ncbi:hypothetical protein EDB19DRAFT_1612133, partial [Suillus lakei]